MASTSTHRLPPSVTPDRYDLHVTCHPDEDTFQGTVEVHVTVHEAVDRVELHVDDITVHEAHVATVTGRIAVEVETVPADELLVLHLEEPLEPGEATLVLAYEGKVHRDMLGLYVSEGAGEGERCLATQCEATAARRILPCFDEPAFKARWRLSVTTAPGFTVLANEPLREREEASTDEELVTWRFQTTPPVSSYLLAFAVGDFASSDVAEARGVPFKAWALGGQEDLGGYARDFAAELLPWYEDYFHVPYPYSKYDQVAIPSFSFGAMENPGLVTFRPEYLLMDPATTTWHLRKYIHRIVSHEFAHMWFGNHVTMAWWDDLWLNEAFAEWIAHESVDDLRPEHGIWFDFKDRSDGALDTDALESTHAIYAPVESAAEAEERFDTITYGKGSAVMRMLHAYLGADAFRQGLRTYMEAFGEENARGGDLWEHLQRASDEPVDRIMGTWIRTPGHPVVHATREGSTLHVRQERFLLDPGAEPGDARWPVPLVLRTPEGEERVLLEDDETTVDVGEAPWVVVNAGDLGFYRVHPDDDLLASLRDAWDALEPAERAGVLRDAWGNLRSGSRDLGAYLELLEQAARGDDHVHVVDRVVARITDLRRMLEVHGDAEALEGLAAWTRKRFRPAYEDLDWDPEPLEDPAEDERRALVLQAMAVLGEDPDAIERARDLARRERADAASVSPDLADVAVQVAARFGDDKHLDTHLQELEARRSGAATPQEVNRYVYSLARFREPSQVARVLELVRAQEVPQASMAPLLRIMLRLPHAGPAAWRFLKEEWDLVEETQGGPWIAILVEHAGNLPPTLREDVEKFLAEALGGDEAQERFARARENLQIREALHERLLEDLAAWARTARAA